MKQPTDIQRHLDIDNRTFIPQIIDLLNDGHSVTINLRGFSMRPFLEDRRDKALLVKAKDVNVGDVVLTKVSTGQYVLHRIIRIDGNEITLRGDGNLNVEQCEKKDVYGFAKGFFRNGHKEMDSTSGRKWRIYSFIWTRIFCIRRYLLYIYRIHRKISINMKKRN